MFSIFGFLKKTSVFKKGGYIDNFYDYNINEENFISEYNEPFEINYSETDILIDKNNISEFSIENIKNNYLISKTNLDDKEYKNELDDEGQNICSKCNYLNTSQDEKRIKIGTPFSQEDLNVKNLVSNTKKNDNIIALELQNTINSNNLNQDNYCLESDINIEDYRNKIYRLFKYKTLGVVK